LFPGQSIAGSGVRKVDRTKKKGKRPKGKGKGEALGQRTAKKSLAPSAKEKLSQSSKGRGKGNTQFVKYSKKE